MTRWVGWIVAWLRVVCLLWSLGLHAGVHHGWDPSVGPWSHAGLTSLHLFPSSSPAGMRPRAGPLEFSTPFCGRVTAGEGGPPWLDPRRPSGAGGRPWVSGQAADAGSAKEGQRTFVPRNSHASIGPTKNRGFATAFSYFPAQNSCASLFRVAPKRIPWE